MSLKCDQLEILLIVCTIFHCYIKTNRYVCVCECIPGSLKMGTGRGGELESALYNFQRDACMKIV